MEHSTSELNPLENLRREVRAWLEANAPQSLCNLPYGKGTFWGGRKELAEANQDQLRWLKCMAERGWTVPTWPVEYGGGGMNAAQARVLNQEMARIGVKKPLENIGIWMLGPALLKYGSEEQKREHLPRIASGEIRWCQGYSEPGAGSDLASVKTRGVDDGDAFIVTGTKIWTTYADKSDWIFALVRTEPDAPKHEGISFLLIDMNDPGVRTRPIQLISGDNHFCETVIDEVRVPKDNVVGKRGQGWEITRYLLQHERSMMGEAIGSRPIRQSLSQIARENGTLRGRPQLREELIGIELDNWALQIWVERMHDEGQAGTFDPVAPSALKVLGTELSKRRSEASLALAGVDGLTAGSDTAYNWLQWPTGTIGGGTTEIQLNIIARRALGLPEKK